MNQYILKLKTTSTVNYAIYDGTTALTDAEITTLFTTAGSAYFAFDFDGLTPTNTTSLNIVDSNDTAVIANTGLTGIAEGKNFKGTWSASATEFDSFTVLEGKTLDESELSFLMHKIKNAGGGIPTTATFWGSSYDSTNNKVGGGILIDDPAGVRIKSSSSSTAISGTITGGSSYRLYVQQGASSGHLYLGRSSEIDISNKVVAIASNAKLTNIQTPTNATDAANKQYVDNLAINYAALNGTSAPTTATEGEYIGQLYYDTTNEQLYFLKEIDTTTDPAEYTWEAVGGGSSVNVVQTTGTSTTDVMSQLATTHLIYGPGVSGTQADWTQFSTSRIWIGCNPSYVYGSSYSVVMDPNSASATINPGAYSVSIGSYVRSTARGLAVGSSATNSGDYGVVIGSGSSTSGNNGSHRNTKQYGGAIGYDCVNTYDYSFAFGYKAKSTRTDEVSFGDASSNDVHAQGKYLSNVKDPTQAQDAATKNYVDTAVASAGATTLTDTEYNNLWSNS